MNILGFFSENIQFMDVFKDAHTHPAKYFSTLLVITCFASAVLGMHKIIKVLNEWNRKAGRTIFYIPQEYNKCKIGRVLISILFYIFTIVVHSLMGGLMALMVATALMSAGFWGVFGISIAIFVSFYCQELFTEFGLYIPNIVGGTFKFFAKKIGVDKNKKNQKLPKQISCGDRYRCPSCSSALVFKKINKINK